MEFLLWLEERQDIKFFLSLIVIVFVSFTLSIIKNKWARQAISSILSLLILFYLFRFEAFHAVFSILVSFFLLKTVPRRWVGLVVFLATFAHVMTIHSLNYFCRYGIYLIDVSNVMMYMVLKASSVAHNYSDAAMARDVHATQQKFLIKDICFFDYIGYILFLPCVNTGPFLEFNQFIEWLNNTQPIGRASKRAIDVAKGVIHAVICGVTFNYLKEYISIEAFNESTGFMKVVAFFLLSFNKLKYFCAFKLCETAAIAAGISYESSTAKNRGNPVINIRKVETAMTVKQFFDNWNITTHRFHKRYVFSRSYRVIGSRAAKVVTFIFSGVWHGIYPVYFFVFAALGVLQNIEDSFKGRRSLLSRVTQRIYKIVTKSVFTNWLVGSYLCLDTADLVKFNRDIHFIPFYLMVGVFLLTLCSRVREKKKRSVY